VRALELRQHLRDHFAFAPEAPELELDAGGGGAAGEGGAGEQGDQRVLSTR
jgi:hypothetical protein